MANIAFIKLFSGMYMSTAQLLGELERTGHKGHIFTFKQYKYIPASELPHHELDDFPSFLWRITTDREVERWTWHAYAPIRNKEFELLVNELHQFKPDALAFTSHSTAIRINGELIRRLREHFKVPIIWGGPGPTVEPERALEHADIVCRGEGEEVIVDLANRLDAGKPLLDMPGTWTRTPDGKIVQNPDLPLQPLNNIAMPCWDMDKFTHINLNKVIKRPAQIVFDDTYPIMTQRGCPFSCSFCIESRYQEMFGKKNSLRRRDPELVIEELKIAKATLPISVVAFWDDVFTINPRWHDKFLPMYKKEIGLPFWCYTYPTTHTRELLEKMKEAGLASITMGVQHGSERILKEYFNRPTSRARVLEATQEILDLRTVSLKIDYLTKVPMETEQDLQEALSLMLQMPKQAVLQGIGETVAYPTFGYKRKLEEAVENSVIASEKTMLVSEADYAFYLTLILLTRSDMPMERVATIARDPSYRKNPEKLRAVVKEADFSYSWAENPEMEENKALKLLFA